jgi:hypothetical protein
MRPPSFGGLFFITRQVSRIVFVKMKALVLTITFLSFFVSSCSVFEESAHSVRPRIFSDGEKTGIIESVGLTESSGIAASRCTEDLLWSHNDSGKEPVLYAFNFKGKASGSYILTDAENIDWEDIAIIKNNEGCDIYIADIGNNYSLRNRFSIYVVSEPELTYGSTDWVKLKSRRIDFSYDLPPNSKVPDAETLMVHPTTKDIYIITKTRSGPSTVFRIRNKDIEVEKLVAKKVGVVSVPSIPAGLLTGGDISPDGLRVALVDYLGAYEFSLKTRDEEFISVFETKPVLVRFGRRTQGESITYSNDGRSLFGTSEGVNPPLIRSTTKND